jgi:hypothetical protein
LALLQRVLYSLFLWRKRLKPRISATKVLGLFAFVFVVVIGNTHRIPAWKFNRDAKRRAVSTLPGEPAMRA